MDMNNISIINCTPHSVSVARSVYGHALVFAVGQRNGITHHQVATGLEVVRHSASGIRLAATAITSGPALGCSVTYEPSAEALDEMTRLKNIFGECQGSRHIVIASEISCRAVAPHIWDGSMASSIEMMWPVLAHESLRLPMGDRWADRLATCGKSSSASCVAAMYEQAALE